MAICAGRSLSRVAIGFGGNYLRGPMDGHPCGGSFVRDGPHGTEGLEKCDWLESMPYVISIR